MESIHLNTGKNKLSYFSLPLLENKSDSPSSIANNLEFNFNSTLKREIINFGHLDDLKSIRTESTKNTSINSAKMSNKEGGKSFNYCIPDPPIKKEKNKNKLNLKDRLKNSARLFDLNNSVS